MTACCDKNLKNHQKTEPANQKWDLVIGPKRGWFDIPFRDLWRYRDLILLFVRRDFDCKLQANCFGADLVYHPALVFSDCLYSYF